MEEFEDEGLHYFIELVDGRVLFLSGQYLYDYEPISDDPESNQPRSFPCTEFTVRRHKNDGCVVDLLRAGTVHRRSWRQRSGSRSGERMVFRRTAR